MNDHTYKKIEVIGCSSDGIEDAIRNAATKAHESIRNLRWFEVNEIRGEVKAGEISQWQVELKLAFTLEDNSSVKPIAEKAMAESLGEQPGGITLETRPRKSIAES